MELDSQVEDIFRLVLPQQKALERLGIHTVKDLLYHFPNRYVEASDIKTISSLTKGNSATIFGTLTKLKTGKAFRKKIPLAEGTLEDDTGKIRVVWFHQPYIAKTFENGGFVKITGKVGENKRGLYFSNPEIARADIAEASGSLFKKGVPRSKQGFSIYPETRGITSRWFMHAIRKVLATPEFKSFKDPIPKEILAKYNLPDLESALLYMHSPEKSAHQRAAEKRFSFEEIFFIQLSRLKTKKEYKENKAWTIKSKTNDIETFKKRFPFPFTNAQERATEQILADIGKDHPMARLLEGDVGSGKTAVAAVAVYAVANTRPEGQDFGRLSTAYMAPTEILARQHFLSFISFFKNSPVSIGLITGSECRKFPSKLDPLGHTKISRTQLLKWVANGEIPVLVGTHALVQKTVDFKHLGLVIIDEQHRFGVMQRARLAGKRDAHARAPHLLSMTATPIPRTLALTIYGDLDLTLLDEMPKGRKEIITKIVTPVGRSATYEHIREELKNGRQAYVICPRIDEPDPEKEFALQVKSAKKEAEHLQKEIFPEFEVALIHSKLKKEEKEKIMEKFASGVAHILVATSIVEVGVNVPNATIIVIEGAERFGLAQLHQLRGRVLRSNHQAYCYLFSNSKSGTALERLKALGQAKNGFELAEKDLAMRGEGSLSGAAQWGLGDLGMQAIKNIKMVEAARIEAQKLLEEDPTLKKHPLISTEMEKKRVLHLE